MIGKSTKIIVSVYTVYFILFMVANYIPSSPLNFIFLPLFIVSLFFYPVLKPFGLVTESYWMFNHPTELGMVIVYVVTVVVLGFLAEAVRRIILRIKNV